MRSSLFLISLISAVMFAMPFLASGFGIHGHARAHNVNRRALVTEVETVTEIAIVSITVDEGAANAISTPAISTPAISTPTPSTLFHPLVPLANSAMLKNSCAYPVYISSTGHSSCEGNSTTASLLSPDDMHIETLRKCAEGGISLKVSKTEDAELPMQFEYTVWQDGSMVSYDISYLNCMKGKDLSGCAGHDGGIQAVGGGDCKRFSCAAGLYCDQQAYVVAEFGYLPGAPVGGCEVEKGVAFEICAGE